MSQNGYALPEAAPFFLSGSKECCCLCIHGFTASSGTYIPLAKKLNEAGFSVRVPLLPGHGTSPEALLGVKYRDWYQAVEAELLSLLKEYEKVNVIGLSLGGALAARLGENHSGDRHFHRLVMMVPLLFLKNKAQYALYPFSRGSTFRYWPPFKPQGDGYDAYRFTYEKMPVRSNRELVKAGLTALLGLKKITVPTLLLEAVNDRLVDPRSCEIAYRRISSEKKEIFRYEKSAHNLLMSMERDAVCQKVLDFLTNDEV